MPVLRIYRPAKSAMQSGRAATRQWRAEFTPEDRKEPDPLMGWNGSKDTRSQIRMFFDSQEAALAFAERRGYSVELRDAPAEAPPTPKAYADNFRFDRVES
jgi:hypothetical protein